MRTNILTALCVATLSIFGVSTANAVGVPMMYEITPSAQANEVLADLLEQSLEKDERGTAPIEGSACTTPKHFAEAIRAYHPGAKLGGVSELPAYIRGLVLKEAPEGEFPMSRILFSKKDGNESCELDTEGWIRPFATGEGVWVDPNTGDPVLAGDCSNVVAPKPDTREVMTSVPPPQGGPCNGTRNILIHAWNFSALPKNLQDDVQELVERQDTRESFWEQSVSRTLGEEIRRRMASTAEAAFTVEVSHLVTKDGNTAILSERHITMAELKWGNAHITVPADVVKLKHAVRFVVPYRLEEYAVLSPTQFGGTGMREIRLFGREWGDDCSMNVHIILKEM